MKLQRCGMGGHCFLLFENLAQLDSLVRFGCWGPVRQISVCLKQSLVLEPSSPQTQITFYADLNPLCLQSSLSTKCESILILLQPNSRITLHHVQINLMTQQLSNIPHSILNHRRPLQTQPPPIDPQILRQAHRL